MKGMYGRKGEIELYIAEFENENRRKMLPLNKWSH